MKELEKERTVKLLWIALDKKLYKRCSKHEQCIGKSGLAGVAREEEDKQHRISKGNKMRKKQFYRLRG